MRTKLADKVVLVTGASSGIGAELCRQLADKRARLALAARDATRLEQVASECRARGADAFVVAGDVSVESDCASIVSQTVAHYGALDVLVNNAGIGFSGRFDEVSDLSVFERVMRVNYLGSVWCTAHALPHLKSSRGLIVAISSLAGLTGVPRRTAYSASKHAMAGFFDSLRIELRYSGVDVTVIYPGFVFSEINQRALSPDGTPYGDRGYKRQKSDTMETDECCRLIIGAMENRQRDLVMTARARFGRMLKLFSPVLVDKLALRTIRDRQ